MSTQTVNIQIGRLQTCIRVLRQRGIDIDHVEIPPDPRHGPRVYVQSSHTLARLHGATYKIVNDSRGRIEHHAVPLDGCQVRWEQRM